MTLLQFMLTGSPGYRKQCRGRRSRLSFLFSCLSQAPPGGGDSRVSQDLPLWDLCNRKWISFMCSVNICIKGSLCHRRRGRAATSFNATAEPISRDKFSTGGGSHSRCLKKKKNFFRRKGGASGNCQATCRQS